MDSLPSPAAQPVYPAANTVVKNQTPDIDVYKRQGGDVDTAVPPFRERHEIPVKPVGHVNGDSGINITASRCV